MQDEKLRFALLRHSTQTNILYALVCDGIVMYVGKTVQSLSQRMAAYRTPGKTQTTNINNRRWTFELIKTRWAIEILALPDIGLMHYGQFHINMAAALEDDIIRKLDPKWNGGMVEQVTVTTAEVPEADIGLPSEFNATFTFVLQPTFFRSGFFKVNVNAQQHLGADGETIELFLGDAEQPVWGEINRRANKNRTPRVMGGTKLRDWCQAKGEKWAQLKCRCFRQHQFDCKRWGKALLLTPC